MGTMANALLLLASLLPVVNAAPLEIADLPRLVGRGTCVDWPTPEDANYDNPKAGGGAHECSNFGVKGKVWVPENSTVEIPLFTRDTADY